MIIVFWVFLVLVVVATVLTCFWVHRECRRHDRVMKYIGEEYKRITGRSLED